MGANPIHYLVVPRFLACLVLIPTLTIMADFMGVVGGAFYCIWGLGIDSNHYWQNSADFISTYDLFSGVFKSLFFGAAIALVSCYRGFNCDPGAEANPKKPARRHLGGVHLAYRMIVVNAWIASLKPIFLPSE